VILEIPEATPSNNQVMRMHHRDRTRAHEHMTWLVRSIAGPRKIPIKECVVSVVRRSEKMLDWDNMGGGLKFLLDALVKNKVIEDDNPTCVKHLNLYQEKCKRGDEMTVVIIEVAKP